MQKLGKYEIREELGRGGMGVVYKGYDSDIEREVAIKVISERALELPEIKARFTREARTAGKLSHENIATVYELGEADGKIFIAMEYLRGHDLRSIIDKKIPLTLTQKLEYAKQICKGLQYAHANNVIHRDIKPENIKILDDGRVKIIDFGIAKPDVGAVAQDGGGATLTMVGARIGTPWYMSPEQVKGVQVDRRSDIFSFGVLLYELLTYTKPFDGDDTTVMYKILHVEPERIHLEESGLVDEIQALLSKCLAKELDARYKDCGEVFVALSAIPDKVEQEKRICALLAEAYALREQGRFNDAIRKFTEVLQINPHHPEATSQIKKLIDREKESATIKVLTGRVTGETISHFKIMEKLGGGGMGVVYKAFDTTLKRIVALKFLSPDLTRDDAAKKRFLKEAQSASALDHPNIGTIHEINETEDGLMFICMTCYEGETLRDKLAKGRLEILECLDIVRKVASGLTEAHKHGIIHRDIKPANIIVTRGNEVKIVDFGLAKLSGATKLTNTGTAVGTLPYMSPEQIKGHELDARTDIWSLGVLLYELLTGQLPFRSEYEAAVLYAIVNEEVVAASKLRPEISPKLEAVITKALKKDVKARYASMQQMLDDLDAFQSTGSKNAKSEQVGREEIARLIQEGKESYEKNQFDQAIAKFESALKLDSNNQDALDSVRKCKAKQEELRQINKFLKDGKISFNESNYRDALLTFKKAISLEPNNSEALEYLEKTHKKIEESERIEKLLTDADFYAKKERYDEAITAYKEVLKVEPVNKTAIRGLTRTEDVIKKSSGGRRRISTKTLVAALGLIVLVVIVVWRIVVGSGSDPDTKPPDGVTAAKQTMLTLKAEAVKVNAERNASKTFSFANQLESTGEGEFSSHKYDQATKSYTDAGAKYKESSQQASALSEKQTSMGLKSEAEKAGAETKAANTYSLGLQEEQKGDAEFSAGNYSVAGKLYQDASASFKKAQEEAATSLDQLKGLVAQSRQSMLAERSKADGVGANTASQDLYKKAVAKERLADESSKKDDRNSLLNAQHGYAEAQDGYKKSAEDVGRRATQKQQWDEATAANTDMESAKKLLPGTETERSNSGKYKDALLAESEGNAQLKTSDYSAARKLFNRAKNLYDDARGEINAAMKTSGENTSVEKAKQSMQAVKSKITQDNVSEDAYRQGLNAENEAVNAQSSGDRSLAEERYLSAEQFYTATLTLQTAKQNIQRLVDFYRTNLEQGNISDLKVLLGFSSNEDKSLSEFFKRSKDRKVNFDKSSIIVKNSAATFEGEGTIAFYNTSNNGEERQPIKINWQLEYSSGKWTIVPRK